MPTLYRHADMGDKETPRGQARDFLFELLAVFIGVLLAVSLGNVSDALGDRRLVAKARATIALEIGENLSEVRGILDGVAARRQRLDHAIRFVDEVLATGSSEIDQIELGFTMAELSSASWQTAAAVGALSLMEYEEVREVSNLYEVQELVVEQQRRSLDRLSRAMGLFETDGDPRKSPREELLDFRREVRAMRSELDVERQVAERLAALYERVLAEP